jgi:uncharacterized OB-fold protein
VLDPLMSPRLALDAGLARGELPYQRCADCAAVTFGPRLLCPGCGSQRLAWLASAGLGTVYATTTMHARDREPYNVVLVDLDEGFRMMSRVDGVPPDDVRIGERVLAEVVDGLVLFHPAGVR